MSEKSDRNRNQADDRIIDNAPSAEENRNRSQTFHSDNTKNNSGFFYSNSKQDDANKSSPNIVRQGYNTINKKAWIPPETSQNKYPSSSNDHSWKQQSSMSPKPPNSKDETSWRVSNEQIKYNSDRWSDNVQSKLGENKDRSNNQRDRERVISQGEEYRDGEYRRERFTTNDQTRKNEHGSLSDREVRRDANFSNERSDFYRNTLDSRDGRGSAHSSSRSFKENSLVERRYSRPTQTKKKNYGDDESEDGEIEEIGTSAKKVTNYKDDNRGRQPLNKGREFDNFNNRNWHNENPRSKFKNDNFHDPPGKGNSLSTKNKVVPSVNPLKQSMGRGRGRGLTLPAWMTHGKGDKLGTSNQSKHSNNDTSHISRVSDVSHPNKSEKIEESHFKNVKGDDNDRKSQNSALHSRFHKNESGRISPYGRPLGNNDSNRQHNIGNGFGERDRSRENERARSFGSEERGRNLLNHNTSDPPFNTGGRGRGRGRGRDLTLPAWMTKKQNNV